MLTIGTGIGGGLILDGELYRGSTGAGAELGHVVIDSDGPPLPGQLPEPRLRRGARLGHGARARGPRSPPSAHPDSALGRRARRRRARSTAALVTEAALAGRRDRASRWWRLIGRRLGVALSSLANIFDPDVIVIGGGVDGRRRPAARARRARSCARGRCRR